MNITLLLSGVLDYKRPLERPASGKWLDLISTPTSPYRLSPFDEAALEIALRLRAEAPDDRSLRTVVTNGASDLNFVRTIAALKLEQIECLQVPAESRESCASFLRTLDHQITKSLRNADIVLMGREHGDLDDGTLPAFIARSWNVPFVSNAVSVDTQPDGSLKIERVNVSRVETVTTKGPVLIAATNHQKNRLRHPLMKNVMQAKKLKFDVQPLDVAAHVALPEQRAIFANMSAMPARSESTQPCQIFQGEDQDKAQQLLRWLKENI